MTLINRLKQLKNLIQISIILQFNLKLLTIQATIMNMMLIQKLASKILKKSWNKKLIVNLQRLVKKRKRLKNLKVLCLMRVKDHLKIFEGMNILHIVMSVFLEAIFNIKLILVKNRKIMSQNKPKILPLRVKTNLMLKLSLFSEHLSLKRIIILKNTLYKILFKLIYKLMHNSMFFINLKWFLKDINNSKCKVMKLRINY